MLLPNSSAAIQTRVNAAPKFHSILHNITKSLIGADGRASALAARGGSAFRFLAIMTLIWRISSVSAFPRRHREHP